MRLKEQSVHISACEGHVGVLDHVVSYLQEILPSNQAPVRIVLVDSDDEGYLCEVGVIETDDHDVIQKVYRGLGFQKRRYENTAGFNVVLLVPTGIGAEIGGHSGDAGALARLMAGCCDTLITHPNVVNAADINELPENGLYVEGSVISRLMMGTIGLQRVRSNRVLLAVDECAEQCFRDLTINSVSAARVALGLCCPGVLGIGNDMTMKAVYSESGSAVGVVERLDALCKTLDDYDGSFDAVGVASLIDVPDNLHADYFRPENKDMVNPWGGVEAILTHALSLMYDIPFAHAPMMSSREVYDLNVGVVEPRKAAEAVSSTYLHCVLKGLHRSPAIVPVEDVHTNSGLLTVADVSCLVIPDHCVGLPTLAALEQGITVIVVRGNRNCMKNELVDYPFDSGQLIIVDNYLEAVGVLEALRIGVSVDAVRRPILDTIQQ